MGAGLSRKKIKLSDIARAANVSISTVSRIINRNADVSPELRDRVQDAALKLGVNLSDRNKAKTIVFLLGNRDMLHPFHSRVLLGAEAYCAKHGYSTLFLSFQYPASVPWSDLALPAVLEGRQDVSGIIVGGTNSLNLLELLSRKRMAFAVLGNNILGEWPQEQYDTVWFDDIRSAYEATRYLQSLGHRAIYFVGNCQRPWISRCYEGYRMAMVEASLPPRVSAVDADQEQEVGYLGTKSVLAGTEPVSAILAGDDATAQGAYRAVRDYGLRIPGDISLASLGETDNHTLDPPLTTIQEFPEQVGMQLATLVLNRIAQPDLVPLKCVVPTRLIKRASCCPPRLPVENSGQADARFAHFGS